MLINSFLRLFLILGENIGEKFKLFPNEKVIFFEFKFFANGNKAINLFS